MNKILGALGLAALVAAGAAQAQTTGSPAKAPPQKPSAGARAVHPDLSGIWQVMNTAGWDVEPHEPRAALQLRPGPVVPVPAKDVLKLGAVGAVPGGLGIVEGGVIPYKPDALKMRDENRADYLNRDPEVKCYLPGVPRANYMDKPLQIFQSEKSVYMAYQYAGAVRDILFQDPGPAPVDSWMGQSVGKWEGKSLVVTVTAQNDQSWFDRAGNHHSADMVVVERWTLTGPNTLRYEATITDPQTFTRPWKLAVNLYRHVGDDAYLGQFKCVPFLSELIAGDLRKVPLK